MIVCVCSVCMYVGSMYVCMYVCRMENVFRKHKECKQSTSPLMKNCSSANLRPVLKSRAGHFGYFFFSLIKKDFLHFLSS